MKPATNEVGSASAELSQTEVRCLRCEQKLDRYRLMRNSLIPNGPGHAMLSCPRCGHVEFVWDSSPLLQGLELVPVDAGDGD
ncbi:MAG: hypothetical protein WAM69_02880 [Candidatus Sulfotelmatobacter sp.]